MSTKEGREREEKENQARKWRPEAALSRREEEGERKGRGEKRGRRGRKEEKGKKGEEEKGRQAGK